MNCVCVCQERLSEVELAVQTQTSLRERFHACEKWVLQTSFRLMAHNTLDVSSAQATQRQVKTHQQLSGEIAEQQAVLQQLRVDTQRLASQPTTNALLSQQLDGQLNSLDESYHSLVSTAAQITVRATTRSSVPPHRSR